MNILMRFPEGKAKAFTMSYDDGVYQDIRLIEIMNKHGLKGTFNINGGLISSQDATKGYQRLSEKQIRELYLPNGHEVALHTYTHPTLVDLPIERITYEYLKDKERLEEVTGTIIRGSAYPNSRYNDKVLAALKACGVSYARGGDQTEGFELPTDWLQIKNTARHINPKLLEIAEAFVNYSPRDHIPCGLFFLMGHSYEFDRDNNWETIEALAEKVGGREDIWYATNLEIYDYIEAYNCVRYNLAQTFAENPTSTDVWVNIKGRIVKIAAGETTQLK
jgi:peptidoglycan/xylan/chitin deacetylase (PgdA/CDA1 family)